VKVELLADALRDDGWWLLVDGSEQSFVAVDDPLHLEFEYVQMIAHLVDAMIDAPVTALHLGGGLCTVPRWLAARHPGSTQTVIEHSAQIAAMSASLGQPPGVTVVIDDAAMAVARARTVSADLVVCDIYEGPETVTSLFTAESLRQVQAILRRDGLLVVNLSDAAPFALTRVVVATLRTIFPSVVMLSEPPVLRGRRSGNLVLAATAREIPVADLTRRGAGGPVRVRVVADDDLTAFVADAEAASSIDQIPASGESTGRRLF
jgi:spermidine synthase